jgi:dTDP-4-dehydrorhamnose 3,5-epimerase
MPGRGQRRQLSRGHEPGQPLPGAPAGSAPTRKRALRRESVIFTETRLKGAFVIDLERREDRRGFFARAFCQNEFEAHGLKTFIAQINVASTRKKGSIRGMHFQYPPAAETKLVRCTRGAILDIIVDLRPESPTYLEHVAVELNEDNHRALYVPERFAHGYQTLQDNTDTSYEVGEFYTPEVESGLLYNDPRLGLSWPLPVTVISDKDQAFPPLDRVEGELKRKMAC